MLNRRTALLGLGASSLLVPGVARSQLRPTPHTDLGPFYPQVRVPDSDHDLTMVRGRRGRATGKLIEVTGRVLDIKGRAVPGARIELWQANAHGRYAHPGDTNPAPLDPNFQGYARLTTDRTGAYRFLTIKPGAYPDGDDSPRPPHIHLDIAGRLDRVVTQMIFPDEGALNAADDVIPERARGSLMATALDSRADGIARYSWDMILAQG